MSAKLFSSLGAKRLTRSTDWAKEEYLKGYLKYPLCRLWPIFPVRLQTSIFGTAKLNFRVRNGNGWTLCVKITDSLLLLQELCVSVDLSFRSVSRQVFSALQSLTSVFGMGTGGPFALKTLTATPSSSFMVHLQGFEPGTHWLRVSCSTNWAKGANLCGAFPCEICSQKTE